MQLHAGLGIVQLTTVKKQHHVTQYCIWVVFLLIQSGCCTRQWLLNQHPSPMLPTAVPRHTAKVQHTCKP